MIQMPQNWKDIPESTGDFPRLTPGGYVAIIRKVTDVPDKNYLEIEYDIAEGRCKGIAVDAYERCGNWSYKFRTYYTPKSMGFFKHFLSAVEKTNNGFQFDWNNPNCLVNRGLGIVVGTRQYYGKDGSLKEFPDVQDYCTATEVREDTLPSSPRVRPPKDAAPVAQTVNYNDDDGALPF
jgi:hypothetical protein